MGIDRRLKPGKLASDPHLPTKITGLLELLEDDLRGFAAGLRVAVKDTFYRPLTVFTGLLAVFFDEDLSELRTHKGSLNRIGMLRAAGQIGEPLADLLKESLLYVMELRMRLQFAARKEEVLFKRSEAPKQDVERLEITLRTVRVVCRLLAAFAKWEKPKGGIKPKAKPGTRVDFLKRELRTPLKIPDEEASTCQTSWCAKRFTKLTRRRHHCRHCGGVFCGKCAPFWSRAKIAGYGRKPQRVCRTCHHVFYAK